jgi:2-polyprenyl-6-hydroxyphenyl methylase/3-demethylubiquinone-9 3-methyltransferase
MAHGTSDPIEFHTHVTQHFDSLYQTSPAFRERFEVWSRLIDRYSHPDNTVLDVGCGTGVFSFYAAERNGRVIGVDGSSGMIEQCRQKHSDLGGGNLKFIEANITTLTEKGIAPADIVLCSSVLEYLPDFDASLEILRGLVTEGGIMIVSMPCSASYYRKLERIVYALTGRPRFYRYVKCRVGDAEVAEKLTQYGFELIERQYFARPRIVPRWLARILPPWRYYMLFVDVARRRARSES